MCAIGRKLKLQSDKVDAASPQFQGVQRLSVLERTLCARLRQQGQSAFGIQS